jgi:hypothetical protein
LLLSFTGLAQSRTLPDSCVSRNKAKGNQFYSEARLKQKVFLNPSSRVDTLYDGSRSFFFTLAQTHYFDRAQFHG